MQINCESLRINLKSDAPFLGADQKMANLFLFLKSSAVQTIPEQIITVLVARSVY